jgi:uncharacterized membrane protein YhaH (DUF805 family)
MARNPYTPPTARVSDTAGSSDVRAYEPGSLGFFFLVRGRLNRKEYWANGILSLLLLPLLFALIGAIIHITWLVAVSRIAVAWSSTVLVVRRTHDFGWSAWWAAIYAVGLLVVGPLMKMYGVSELLTFLVPFLILLVFGMIPGDSAANRFGAPQGDGPQMQRPA